MRELQVLGDGHLKLDFADWKEFFETEMAEQLRHQLKNMIEQALEAERDYYLQLNYYEHAPRCRLDYRNGYYFRDFLTQLGRLAGVRIPRTRKGFRSLVLPRYQRRQAAVNQLIREAFLRGISTRQVSAVLQPVLGETYSAETISNITRQLDTAVQQFHRGPLLDEYLYLFLDGIVLKVRDSARKVRRRMILVAYGVTRAGLRRVLAYQFAQDESQAAWEQFLQDLYLRGLQGKTLQLIVSDGGKGLQAALPFISPTCRCSVAGPTSSATSPTKSPARKAPVWRQPPPCIERAVKARHCVPSATGSSTGSTAAPTRWLVWSAISTRC